MDDSNISNSGYTEKSNEKDIVFHSEKETSRIPIQIEDEGKTPASPAKHPSDNQESSQTNNINLNSQTLMNSPSDSSGKELPQKTPIPQARKQSSKSEGLLEVTPLGPDNMSHRDDEEIFIQKDDEETETEVDDEETETEVDDEETEILDINSNHRKQGLLKQGQQVIDETHHCIYNILEIIGKGSYGVVYKTTKTNLFNNQEEIKALKEYNPEFPKNSKYYSLHKQTFKQEYETLASLNHKNIVSVTDFFQADDTYYYDMEFIEGESLDCCIEQNLEEKVFDIDDNPEYISDDAPEEYERCRTVVLTHKSYKISKIKVFTWIYDLLNMIYYLHKHNILHLNLKLENIIQTNTGHSIVMGFGHCKNINKEKDFSYDISALGKIYYSFFRGRFIDNLSIKDIRDLYIPNSMKRILCRLLDLDLYPYSQPFQMYKDIKFHLFFMILQFITIQLITIRGRLRKFIWRGIDTTDYFDYNEDEVYYEN